MLYALGDNFFLHSLFFQFIPGFDKFRVPARMIFYFTFGCSLLSAFGLQDLFEKLQLQPLRLRRAIVSIAAAGIIVWLMAQSGAFQSAHSQQQLSQIRAVALGGATTGLVFLLILAGILLLASRRTISPTAALGAFFALQLLDINVFGFEQNNGSVNPDDYYASKSDAVNLVREDGKLEYFRINSRLGGSMILDRNQGMLDRVFMMEGYTPLSLQRIYTPGRGWDQTCDMLNAKYRLVVDRQNQSMRLGVAATYLPRAYMVYRAKIVRDENEERTFMASPDFEPSRTVVLEKNSAGPNGSDADRRSEPPDTAYTSAWSASITSYDLNEMRMNVTSPKDGYLVLSEIYYPGWNAYVDGAKRTIHRADWNLRAIHLPGGSHRVEVRFEPESFRTGFRLTASTVFVAALILGGAPILARRKRERKIDPVAPGDAPTR